MSGYDFHRMSSSRSSLVLSGFFGRGNCGDEAILQVQYEVLSPHYEIIISVDERGAYDGFWNWYPYDRCRIVHQGDLGVVAEDGVVGIHVGGGGIPLGFNAGQVVEACFHGRAAILSGIDARQPMSDQGVHSARRYLGLFSRVYTRTDPSWRKMCNTLKRARNGADWALALQTDCAENAESNDSVLITIRELPRHLAGSDYLSVVGDLLRDLAERFGRVVLLPFCPEDDRFLDSIPGAGEVDRAVHWWNPRRVQQEISRARLLISLGRLHPMVFAANVAIPAVYVEPKLSGGGALTGTKGRDFCSEGCWSYHSDIHSFRAVLDRLEFVRPIAFSREYRVRWNEMVADILKSLGHHATPDSTHVPVLGKLD